MFLRLPLPPMVVLCSQGGTMGDLENKVLASGVLPDRLLRRVVRYRVKSLVKGFDCRTAQEQAQHEASVVARFESGPITVNADDANRQHYDLPPEFFEAVLGPRLKYSCCYWPAGVTDLAQAEEAMLELTAERAGLGDGQDILDLGCGWGSLALWAAERYPRSRVVAMSNSNTQRGFIENLRDQGGLDNLDVVTADVGRFEPRKRFDRVVSVEMFEHARNHRALLDRVAGWLKPEGTAFRSHLLSSAAPLRLRDRWERRVDGPALLFRRRDALLGLSHQVPGQPDPRRSLGGGRPPLLQYAACMAG